MDGILTAVQMTPQRFEKCLLRQSINYVVSLGLIVVKYCRNKCCTASNITNISLATY